MSVLFNDDYVDLIYFNDDDINIVTFNDETVFLNVPTFSKACKYKQQSGPITTNHQILVDGVVVSNSSSNSGSGTFYIDVNGNVSATSIANSRAVVFSYTFTSTFVRSYTEQYMEHKVYNNVFNVTIGSTTKQFSYMCDVNTSSMGSTSTYMPEQTWTQNV